MKVGYLPDFLPLPANQSNFTHERDRQFFFSRGINPSLIGNNLYFWLQSPDGSKVFSTWLTDYASHPSTLGANLNDWIAYLVEEYPEPGQFHPSIKSYLKRNQELPIIVPVGADQHPYQPEVKQLVTRLKSQYQDWNLELGDYESALVKIKHALKRQNTTLPTVDIPLKEGVTKPVHRGVASTRIDLKQLYYELESLLIDMIEPMSVMCQIEKIDVPWAMIELILKTVP
ncbi:hypothetical protein [Mycoplasma sp. ATU-Cv-508]|uniref:hypothetical protein n=1 Tax=Mycoplasma sp. ATU-Cv-508 TaxID=2048001 RepID=UPI001374A039